MFLFLCLSFDGLLAASFLRFGEQLANRSVCGSNARSVALLQALRDVIDEYKTPEDKDLCRDLQTIIKPHIR